MVKQARRMLVRQGHLRFGPPAEEIRHSLDAVTDFDGLEQLCVRLLDVSSWEELLAEPPQGPETP